MTKLFTHKSADDYSKMLNSSVLVSLLSLLIGGVLLFFHDLDAKVIGYICGATFLLSSFDIFFKFFKRDGAKIYRFNPIFSIVLVILSLFLFVYQYSMPSFITVIFGLFLVTIGSCRINYSIWFKIANDSSWFLTLMIGLMIIIFGIMLILNPFDNLALNELIGAFLIFSSVLSLTDTIMLKKRADSVVKLFW